MKLNWDHIAEIAIAIILAEVVIDVFKRSTSVSV